MLTRRKFLQVTAPLGAAAMSSGTADGDPAEPAGILVNDVQSQVNATRVARIVEPTTVEAIQEAIRTARREGRAVSVCAGRHAMGGQQFGSDSVLLDTRKLNRVRSFDRAKGIIEVQAGIEWPELLAYLHREQEDGKPGSWTIRQKQTGVDRVSLAGTLSANAHGRGLRFKPIIDDVESFDLVDADGKLHTCSRRENAELFGLAIGGYGLFGVIVHVKLRLVPRRKIQRVVRVIEVRDLMTEVDQRVKEGFLYGDCQYSTDLAADGLGHAGVFACYRPVDDATAMPSPQKVLSQRDWGELVYLAHTDRKKAFAAYAEHYRATDSQLYWSDTHQLSGEMGHYHDALDRRLGAKEKGTEMISEVYVKKDDLAPFLLDARKDVIEHKINLIYGTIRFIDQDSDSFLAWAKNPSVCVLCNLHIDHTEAGLQKAAADFRRLFARAVQHGGRYFLTYHRWATREQVEAAYPQFVEFLRLKKKHDPQEVFQSDWYRHYKAMFADKLA